MGKVWRDLTGRRIKVGDAIAYSTATRDGGIKFYEVLALRDRSMSAMLLGNGDYWSYSSRSDKPRRASTLQKGENAFILNDDCDTVATFKMSRRDRRQVGGACPNCGEELDPISDDRKIVAIGCNSCGAMYDLGTEIA